MINERSNRITKESAIPAKRSHRRAHGAGATEPLGLTKTSNVRSAAPSDTVESENATLEAMRDNGTFTFVTAIPIVKPIKTPPTFRFRQGIFAQFSRRVCHAAGCEGCGLAPCAHFVHWYVRLLGRKHLRFSMSSAGAILFSPYSHPWLTEMQADMFRSLHLFFVSSMLAPFQRRWASLSSPSSY